MNRVSQPDRELLALMWAACDGSVTSAEYGRLAERLDNEEGARLDYLRFVSLVIDLESKIQAENVSVSQNAPSHSSIAKSSQEVSISDVLAPSAPLNRRLSYFSRPALQYVALVALCLYGSFVLVAWNLRPSKPNGKSAVPVAFVRDTADVEWSRNTSFKSARASVLSGEILHIESGTMELELKAGTKIIVEGPADWSVEGENSVLLRAGKILATVPVQAIGFSVETPTAKIVDLGTEFGVEVDNSQNTNVIVVKGEVSVGNVAQAVGKNQEIRLSAGQAARLTASGNVARQSESARNAIASEFARSLSRHAKPNAHDDSPQQFGPKTRSRLLSLYPFDSSTINYVVGAADGTLEGADGANNLPRYVSGKIGAKAVSFDGVDDRMNATIYGYPKASLQKEPSNGLWTGSAAFWINTTASKSGYVLGSQEGNTTLNLIANPDNISGQWLIAIRTSALNVFATTLAEPDSLWRNGDWHHVVITWNITTGAAGTGVGAIWIDGVSKPTKITLNGATATDGFNAWEGNPMLIGARSKHGAAGGFFTGSLDDVGIWNSQLTEPEVKALYNLGNDAVLNYNARDVQIVLDVFGNVPGAKGRTSDGRTWKYATELSGNSAEATDNRTAIILDAVNHTGVQMISNPQK